MNENSYLTTLQGAAHFNLTRSSRISDQLQNFHVPMLPGHTLMKKANLVCAMLQNTGMGAVSLSFSARPTDRIVGIFVPGGWQYCSREKGVIS